MLACQQKKGEIAGALLFFKGKLLLIIGSYDFFAIFRGSLKEGLHFCLKNIMMKMISSLTDCSTRLLCNLILTKPWTWKMILSSLRNGRWERVRAFGASLRSNYGLFMRLRQELIFNFRWLSCGCKEVRICDLLLTLKIEFSLNGFSKGKESFQRQISALLFPNALHLFPTLAKACVVIKMDK